MAASVAVNPNPLVVSLYEDELAALSSALVADRQALQAAFHVLHSSTLLAPARLPLANAVDAIGATQRAAAIVLFGALDYRQPEYETLARVFDLPPRVAVRSTARYSAGRHLPKRKAPCSNSPPAKNSKSRWPLWLLTRA